MKNILEQATNKVNIVGKLLDTTFNHGVTKTGAPYERANLTIRVTQTYNGQEEVSEIPVSMFASQFTSKGTPNPAYKSIQDLKEMKTAQNVGFDAADTVRITSGTVRENNFVAKSGQLINGWQLNTSFINKGSTADVASFLLDIFIMDMHDEIDRNGEPTGRLIIKGGLVQYNGKLDVLEFVVEGSEKIDYIQRNWEINQTVTVKGRIRVTSVEEKSSGSEGSWGEEIPEINTRMIRELVISTGSDEGKEEEFSYDPTDIKKAFNVRKAEIEQLLIDARQGKPAAQPAATATATASSKYSWE